MILNAPWFSSVPLKSLTCQLRGLWRTRGWSSCTNHSQHPVCTWLQRRTWWAECPLCCCFWLETQLQQSLTCSASARMLASHLAAPTQLLWTDEGAAISTKSTSGCGGFGRGKPRLGGLSVDQTATRQDAVSDAQHKRAADKTGSQDCSSLIQSKGWYISVYTKL
jgi:hypothetical protein